MSDPVTVDDGCLVAKSFLSEVAFDLLSSSTVDRYARMAIEAGSRWIIEPSACPASQGWPPPRTPTTTEVLQRAQHLWKQVCTATKRDVDEAELAILLSATSLAGTAGVDELLATVSNTTTYPGSAKNWIVALARVLWQERQKTITGAAAAKIQAILSELPDEEARQLTLQSVMENRCPRCFDYNPRGEFWCCYESRGG
jgi:hypothetical protein